MLDSLHPGLEWQHLWLVAGPVVSGLVLRAAYKKYHQPNTILRRYDSNDVCIFYQFWVRFIGNLTISILSIPPIAANTSCNVRKWLLLWTESMVLNSHVPSLLDFCMRTNNTPFYHMFHSRSPYNHLFIIVLCTWVPLITSYIIGGAFPQSETDPPLCDSLQFLVFFNVMGDSVLFLLRVLSRLYIVVTGIARNKHVRDSVIQRFNQILWIQQIGFFITLLYFLMMRRIGGFVQEDAWEQMKVRRFAVSVVGTSIDVLACALIPPTAPKLERAFTKVMSTFRV